MGCLSSAPPQVSNQARRKQQELLSPPNSIGDDQTEKKSRNTLHNLLHESVQTIIKGISKIPKPPNLHPLVCLNEYTSPIAIAILSLSSGNTTEIYLPVVAISLYNNQKLMLIGQIELLALCVNTNTEASAFLENTIRWTGGVGRNNYKILLLQIEPTLAQQIEKNLKCFDFIVNIHDEMPDNLRYHIIITTMQCKYADELREYKGGLIIADVSESTQEESMREFLLERGLSFPNFSLSIGNVTSEFVRTNKGFKELNECTFLKLIKSYKSMVQDESDMGVQKYDNLVTALRYHIIVLPRCENEHLLDLSKAAFQLLENTNYISEEGICPAIIHGITVVLLTEILHRLPAKTFEGQHWGERFPGEVIDPQLGDFRTHHEFHCEEWSSSGLYIPSGVIGHATLSKPCKNVHIQIGCHVECTLSQTGPWKRWPIIFETYDFEDGLDLDFCSPFGGIVYVVMDEYSTDDPSIEFDVTFRNVIQYPIYTSLDPSIYDEVKGENNSPWMEIETQFIIITIPSDKIELFGELSEYCTFIDQLIAEVLQFTSDVSQKLYRLVFDIELPNDKATCNYPISMPMKMIEAISQKKPSVDLFLLIYYIGTLSVMQMNFGDVDGHSLGMIAASHAFKSVFKDINPLEYNAETPPDLFSDLYNIYTQNNPEDFTKSFEDIRRMYEIMQIGEKRVWEIFVQKISGYAGTNLAPKLIKSKEESTNFGGGVLISYSSKSLSEFQLPDAMKKDPVIDQSLVPVEE
ncbi:hypothetical protein TRFO_05257 [Tritrichomonas foetus]|uniref:Peptidase M60 domain-containing protein n=1 Tax=Tritrichomonas foetus TaxID=1144522 RepID=A0A1J4K857_9EUKA|nr:hypothetical protein TRFO_05257 [Tritrichomonas foetus]|eukprot:OHT07064.1 hypothetical protein TRFO_05257 [Tritrichomonas foetus]